MKVVGAYRLESIDCFRTEMQLKVTWRILKPKAAKPASLSEGMTTDGGGVRMIQHTNLVRVSCPICGGRIADRLARYDVEIKNMMAEEEPDGDLALIEKCHKCKCTVGIKIKDKRE